MREIKFRGKVDGVWQYVTPDDDHRWEQFWWYVDRETVGQYVGCNDHIGKGIYNGDIVRLKTGPNSSISSIGNYEVYWSTEKWYGVRWQLRDGKGENYDNGIYDDERIEWEECEVIGNIYEHPSLLAQ